MGYHPQSEPNPFWAQAAWFIDPVGGNDDNDGLTALTPVKTWAAGVVARLGTESPTLDAVAIGAANVAITFLDSQPDASDPVTFTPFCQRCTFTVNGTRTLVVAAASGAVTAKNRATGQVLQANLPAGTFPGIGVGQLVINTTRGNSVAFISKALGADNYELTQPLTPRVSPTSAYAGVPTEVDTWAVGDALEVYSLSGIYGGKFAQISGEYIPPNFEASTLANLHFISPDGPSDSNVTLGANMSMLYCWSDQEILDETAGGGLTTLVEGCILADVQSGGPGFYRFILGGQLKAVFGSNLSWGTDLDVLLDASGASITFVNAYEYGIQLGLTALRGVVGLACSATAAVGGYALGASTLWNAGGATLNITKTSRLSYAAGAGTAAATFVNNLVLLLNAQATASNFAAATNTWTGPFGLTAANLDNAASLNGLAVNVGGASISNQGTP